MGFSGGVRSGRYVANVGLADGEIERVRVATDIVAIISERTALKRSGTRWSGLCPFHTERTGSFSVNAAEGFYYCFGCHAKGDAITFVRETQHLDFIEAVEYLAGRAGIELQHDEQSGAARQERKRFLEVMEKAVEWYHQQLLTAPEAGPARNYLRSRGYDGDVVRQFRLGWAPDGWDNMTKSLNLSAKDLEGTGLGFVNSRGNRQDALRGRIIFPIFDTSNHAIAVGGRILPPAPGEAPRDEAKYKNSPETPIYSKRRTLYALNWAKENIVKTNEIIVCEGYTDVIAFFRAGFPRAVATCGTALSEEHFRTMRNFAPRIVLAYDGDSAGQNAAASVYQWEQQFDAEVVVAKFPPGVDPAELAQSDPSALGESIAQAVPFLQFRLERVLASANFSTPESRARAAEAALVVVAEHPSDLVRDQYLQMVADKCRMEVDALRPRLARVRTNPRREVTPTVEASNSVPDYMAYKPGVEALRRMIHEPQMMESRLVAEMFSDPIQRTAFHALASGEPLVHCIEDLNRRGDEWAADLLAVLAVEEPIESSSADEVESRVTELVAQMLRAAVQDALADVNRQMRDGIVTAESGLMVIRDVRQRLELLGQRGYESVEQELREWLVAFGHQE